MVKSVCHTQFVELIAYNVKCVVGCKVSSWNEINDESKSHRKLIWILKIITISDKHFVVPCNVVKYRSAVSGYIRDELSLHWHCHSIKTIIICIGGEID